MRDVHAIMRARQTQTTQDTHGLRWYKSMLGGIVHIERDISDRAEERERG